MVLHLFNERKHASTRPEPLAILPLFREPFMQPCFKRTRSADLPEHDEEDNAVEVEPGKRGELVWRFTKAGSFSFGCLIPGHFEAGMIGKLTVVP